MNYAPPNANNIRKKRKKRRKEGAEGGPTLRARLMAAVDGASAVCVPDVGAEVEVVDAEEGAAGACAAAVSAVRGAEAVAVKAEEGTRDRTMDALTKGLNKIYMDDIPEELLEPCKVYVTNLRPTVNEKMLGNALSYYVNVKNTIIIKDQHTRRSKGYGFVTVTKPQEVDILLNLPHCEKYLNGSELIIKRARKRIFLPGHHEYVRTPLPDRDFDLSLPDTNTASIHMLVDDVIYKIFEYLPIKDCVRSERVCRRWQMLVHGMFTKVYKLEIAPGKLGISAPITKSIISKLLILSGPTLKELKLQSIDNATRSNILRIVGQLCPQLECLDVSLAHGINFANVTELTNRCKNLKAFVAVNCAEFNERALHQLLSSYPGLQRLNISGCSINGNSFHLLPNTLKDLNISFCMNVYGRAALSTEVKQDTHKGLYQIADRCKELEALEMEKCRVTKDVLEHIGNNCHNLSKLSVFLVEPEAYEGLKNFKNLKDLTVSSVLFDLSILVEHMPLLQRLCVDARLSSGGRSDFSAMSDLRYIKLCHIEMTEESLRSLSKCCKLEEVVLMGCGDVSQDVLLDILKGCPGLKRIYCLNVNLNLDFVKSVDNIMKKRTGKVTIAVRMDYLQPKELLEAQYDTNKIEFEHITGYPFLFDPSDYDDDDADSFYSAGSLEDYWMNGFDGFDSDQSLPDALIYGDQLDFLHDPFLMYGLGYFGSEDDSDFSD